MELIDYIRAMMWIIGGATALIALAVGAILAYHWKNYSTDAHAGKIAIALYTGVALFLMFAMFAMTPAF